MKHEDMFLMLMELLDDEKIKEKIKDIANEK